MDLWRFLGISLRQNTSAQLPQLVDLAREMDISRLMSLCPLQDPVRFRAKFLGAQLAEALIDNKGALQLEVLESLLAELRTSRFFIAPYLENDSFLFEHVYACLQFLLDSEAARQLLHKCAPPLCHRGADRLVRDTLWPRVIQEIRAADVKKAILAALLTWLRQTTGSCFATAPAILIQQEQPLLLLQDLFDLLTFGTLKRVVSGREYVVPLCPSVELADLVRPLGLYDNSQLAYAPGLRAAFAAAGIDPTLYLQIEGAQTPKELIERTLLRALDLKAEQIQEEEGLKKLEMNALLAKQSAIYYQKPTARAIKVAEWKKKKELAFTAYQALGDCALLRAWESTVASFSDVKVNMGRWNLYVSLGMHADQPGGIGAFLYERINGRLQQLQEQMQGLQLEYEHAISLARNAERQGNGKEYASAMYRTNTLLEQSKNLSKDSEILAKLFSEMMHAFDRLIPESFQEVFDPSLATNLSDMIDDSPAGFRLAYKHGRTDSSQWTFLRSSDEFISSLRDFLASVERELSAQKPEEKILIESLSTELIQYIQTSEFLQGAYLRIKQNPTMQTGLAKPWEYISGGTMPALVMTYFNRSEPFTCLERKIPSEEALLHFLLEGPLAAKRVLIHSPTHAFIFRPDWLPVDIPEAIKAMGRFWETVEVADEAVLAEKFSMWLTPKEQSLFHHLWRQQEVKGGVANVRQALIQSLQRADKESLVDSFLYESLPLIPARQAIEFGQQFNYDCTSFFADAAFFTPTQLRERLKAAALRQARSPLFAEDLDLSIASELRRQGLAAPHPILFADTNWSAGFFGLAVSPHGGLHLWRFQRTGMSGSPMRQWFQLQRDGIWMMLTRPAEYVT